MGIRALRTPSLFAGLVALAAGLLVSAPAHAGTARVPDEAGDTWEAHYTDDGELREWSRGGSALNTDIEWTELRHRAARVVLVTSFAELERRDAWFWVFSRLRVDGMGTTLHIDHSAGRRWSGDLSLYTIGAHRQVELRCARAGAAFDYAHDRATVWIPRRCLGDPAWVRVASSATSETMTDSRYFNDVYDSTGHGRPGWTRQVPVAARN